ncbi:FKBP-type peptidyl-prolyl cis-trans isomerase [Mucilaginibacter glaciei]|uniref:Peptidyl-prolyl cis-trans isomerase n=1 Tax=Mucilaginibacter glaciei TaxID=2772109 RepID=A0A926NR01_9SPHI|nr:FKBP-type peptidyl-prolyl cis-trans isomerase [Mucilaginibacter glaciei]MBD1393067.1 FKBP-type peptidyl-prolyl cis-trans isomerase [Mucilaginibacter glaciei]
MNRVLLILLVCVVGFASCKKAVSEVDKINVQAGVDNKIILDYLATNSLSSTAKQLDSAGVATGIYYVVLAPGTGNALFTNSTNITVDFTGKELTTGKLFTNANNFHATYALGAVIRAWKLAIPQIKKGGRIRILTPSRYAYGAYDQPDIGLPANSVVDFDITLIDVTN